MYIYFRYLRIKYFSSSLIYWFQVTKLLKGIRLTYWQQILQLILKFKYLVSFTYFCVIGLTSSFGVYHKGCWKVFVQNLNKQEYNERNGLSSRGIW